MKKSLIALAALAASAAFAQSSVTLSGNLDVAFGNQSGGSTVKSASTVSTNSITSSTSVIRITAVEDLGGGMKATAHYGIDPRAMFDNNTKSASSLGRDEAFVGLTGGFGTVKLGSPNSLGLEAFLATSPSGTGIGSGYKQATAAVNTRYDRSMRYDSNNLAGWTVSVLHAPGAAAADASTGVLGAAARKTTELGLTYANGPLAVKLVNISQAADAGNAKTAFNVLGGQYNLGATTLYAAYMNGDLLKDAATAAEASGSRLAVKHTIGAVDLIASVQSLKLDNGADAGKKYKTTGLRADYNLSKTAAVYAGYEDRADIDTTKNLKLTSFGLRKSF